MSESITFPGDYKLLSVMIYPANGSEPRVAVNIRNMIGRFNIIESILNDSIRGSMVVTDSSGLLEGYPIRGEEGLLIEVMDAMNNKRIYRMFVYRVDNVTPSALNDRIDYTLHFTSYQRFIADQSRVIESYNKPAGEIVESIFNRFCRQPVSSRPSSTTGTSSGTDPNKQIIVESTEGVLKVIIPRLTPIQAIKFLESRSYSTTSPTCSYRFFENADSFYFVSDEFLYRQSLDNDKIFEFTHSEKIPKDSSHFVQQMMNLETLTNGVRVDTFDDLHGGTYRNKVIVLDIVNRVTNLKAASFSYNDTKDSYFKGSEDLNIADRHSDSFVESAFNDENARHFIMVKDYVEQDVGQLRGEQFLPEITSNRLSYFKNLNSFKVSASGPGRLDLTCGDYINIKVPEFRHVKGRREMNAQMSGVYLVESVTRSFVNEGYKNQYSLIKRNWARAVDPSSNQFLLGGVE